MSNIFIGGSSGTDLVQSVNITPSTVTGWGYLVKCDANGLSSNLVLNLPSAIAKTGQRLTVSKVDSSNNCIQIVQFSGQTINGSTQNIYLYNNSDSIVLQSDGSNYFLVSDNRNSIGSSNSFLRISRTSAQTSSISVGNNIIYSKVETIIGDKATLNTLTGVITLASGSTYSLKGSISGLKNNNTSTCWCGYRWYTSIDNGTTWSPIGDFGETVGVNSINFDPPSVNIATSTVSTVTTTLVKLQLTNIAGAIQIGGNGDISGSFPWAEVEEISRQATVINTVDYLNAIATGGGSQVVANNGNVLYTKNEGNINYSNGQFSLVAGKTYSLKAQIQTSSGDNNWQFYDNTNSKLIGTCANPVAVTSTNNSGGTHIVSTTITSSSNITVSLRNITGSSVTLWTPPCYIDIFQIGSSAVSNVPLSLVGEITDNSPSNYLDIGTMRIQWGTSGTNLGSQVTITLPAPFANASYSVVPVIISSNTASMFSINVKTFSTTSFSINKLYLNGTTTTACPAEAFTWQAIGLKP